tara:strand:- start:579 stop:878 length:300 start_codon:yes stop_codon:yes gene_type:complete
LRKRILQWIGEWKEKGYHDDIPDEVPDVLMRLNKAPSYRQVCLAILTNDVSLKSLGLTPKVSSYYNELKRIEINARPVVVFEQPTDPVDVGIKLTSGSL